MTLLVIQSSLWHYMEIGDSDTATLVPTEQAGPSNIHGLLTVNESRSLFANLFYFDVQQKNFK